MILAGQGVLYAEASAELVELADLLQAPVMTTVDGKSGFPEDHPLALGSGGNTFKGSFFISGLNDKMQGDNFDSTQLSVLAAPAKSLLLRDYQVSVGGPIKQDRMWFFFNHRRIDSADAQPGIFANKNAGDPTKFTYVPDFSQQGRIDQKRRIFSLRLTTQLTPKNKLMLFWDEQPQCSGAAWPGVARVPDGAASWDPLLSTGDAPYRVPDDAHAHDDDNDASYADGGGGITLPPYTAALYRREQQ